MADSGKNTDTQNMDKAYVAAHDQKWQKVWDDVDVARPEVSYANHQKNNTAKNEQFSLLMPPPNVTGVLHTGHALMLALEDTLVRWQRMKGVETLYLPGTDHASIAVNMQVVKHLESKGIDHKSLGREGFIEECWMWIKEYQPRIFGQIKSMGVSCDWSRVKFTMDPELNKGVTKAFVEFHKKGLIYRDEKLVNWSPRGQTVLSDVEVIFKEQKGHIWHMKYPLADDPTQFLIVATTRPETMLGDSAVAVHPNDERYRDLVGKMIKLPIVGREIPIVADDYVDPEFGTGAVKITPAHDFNDFEVGTRHNLPRLNIFTPDAKIIKGLPLKAAEWAGLDRFDARKEVVAEFEKLGLMEKIEDHQNRVGTSERGGEIVEPYLSYQWFMKMDTMAARAKKYVEDGDIEILPKEFHNQFLRWMENCHDWCISRQLWWGQQIPAYHCQKTGEMIVSEETPKNDDKHEWVQDSDVLDTWFSSGIWPLTTLGWPKEDAIDLNKFFPTTVLETGFDIIFFWVARMVMMTSELTGKIPFKKVYMHPMVRDEHGNKMSKSKGNVIDPLEMIEAFGADTLRLTMNALCVQGRDLKLSNERLEFYRAFINKVWNATRFALMNEPESAKSNPRTWMERPKELRHLHDQWIIARLDKASIELNGAWSEFKMQEGVDILYHFIWNDFCDWYLECSKSTREDSDKVVKFVLGEILKLLHPLCPHATEELWAGMPGIKEDELIALASFPDGGGFPDPQVFAEFKFFQESVTAIRNLKAEAKVSPSKKINVKLSGAGEMSRSVAEKVKSTIMTLAKLETFEVGDFEGGAPLTRVPVTAVEAGKSVEIVVPVTELKDLEEEKKRLAKEIEQMEKLVKAQESKLSNENFVKRAPPELVDNERVKKEEYLDKASKLAKALKDLG